MDEIERKQLQRRQRLERLIKEFGLPRNLWDKYSLASFEVVPGNELAYKTALEFLSIPPELKSPDEIFNKQAEIDAWYDRQPILHYFLTFVGDCGRGKTHLVIALGIWQITKLEESAVYWQVPELLLALRDSFEKSYGPSYEQIMGKCKTTELLILDDLGMQKNTDWAIEQLDSLIDYRYVREMLTIFTTNLKPSRLPPRIASRIKEGEVVTLTCGDYRELKAKRRIEKREVSAEPRQIIGQGR